MNLCSHNHDEICYETYHCPLCETTIDLENAEKERDDLQEKVDELEETIERCRELCPEGLI